MPRGRSFPRCTVLEQISEARQRSNWLVAVADPVRLKIVRTLSDVADATAADLASQSQISDQTLRRHLEALVASGVIQTQPGESDGETPGRPPARFSLAPEVRESVCSVFSPQG